MNITDVIKKVLITEKSTSAQAENKYTFSVDPRASKYDVKRAVEKLFGVKVLAVRTMNFLGKPRRLRWYEKGRKANWKKAIVTLAEGQRIEIAKE